MKFPITYTIDKESIRASQIENAKRIIRGLKGQDADMCIEIDRESITNACTALTDNEYQMQVLTCDVELHYSDKYHEMYDEHIQVWVRCKVWGFSSCCEVGFSYDEWLSTPYDEIPVFVANSYIREYKAQ